MRRTRIMKGRKAVKKPWLITALIAAAAIVGSVTWTAGTKASLIAEDKVTNTFDTGALSIANVENGKECTEGNPTGGFSSPESWNGTTEITKEVQVKNTNTVPVIIRTALVPRWTTSDGSAWAGDTSCVSLNMNSGNVVTDIKEWTAGKWYKANDGYYYYNGIVPPEGTKDESGQDADITSELLQSVSANIPEDLKDRYDGKKLVVDVKSEGVLATLGTYKNVWLNVDKSVADALDHLLPN